METLRQIWRLHTPKPDSFCQDLVSYNVLFFLIFLTFLLIVIWGNIVFQFNLSFFINALACFALLIFDLLLSLTLGENM